MFQAHDTRLKRDVAIKVILEAFAHDSDRLARFQREAELLATLKHPNIAAVYGLEQSDGVTGIVLELVEGDTLADVIGRGPIAVNDLTITLPSTAPILAGSPANALGPDVTRDGKRFVMIKPIQDDADARTIRVIENWFEELTLRAPIPR